MMDDVMRMIVHVLEDQVKGGHTRDCGDNVRIYSYCDGDECDSPDFEVSKVSEDGKICYVITSYSEEIDLPLSLLFDLYDILGDDYVLSISVDSIEYSSLYGTRDYELVIKIIEK